MTMRLLVLGGSAFVGRALVEDGLARGWDVTTFNRGQRAWRHPDAEALTGDRLDPATLAPLGDRDWDVVADTWSGAPRAARDSAAVLEPRTAAYAYVSTGSVYADPQPLGATEDAPTVESSPDAERTAYAEDKRGSELALAAAFGDRVLFARAGLVLGPHEDVGRLPWWLQRVHRGGEVLAPGPVDQPLQFVDARDLARFALDGAEAGRSGPFNVVARRGHATMGSLPEACVAATAPTAAEPARLTWVEPDRVLGAGIAPWTELPVWIPPDSEDAGIHDVDVSRAHAAGLRCRPAEETVADTWAWLSSLDGSAPLRADLAPPGLAADRERAALAAWHARS